ncbi:polysaccharide biosynthesis C-terminal domain-containing protein [Vibrio breoganii]
MFSINSKLALLITAIVAKLSMFAVEIIPKIVLETDVYGKFSYSLSIVTFWGMLFCFGSGNYLVSAYFKDRNAFNNSIVISSSIFFIAVSITTTFMHDYSMFKMLVVAYFFSILFTVSTLFRILERNIEWYFYKDILKAIVFFILFYALFFYNYTSLNYLIAAFGFSLFVCFLLVLFVLNKELNISLLNVSLRSIFSHMCNSFPVIFTGLTYIFLSRLDSFFLKDFVSSSSLGDYISVSRISYQSLFIQQIIVAKVASSLARLMNEKNILSCNDKAKTARKYNFWGTLILSLLIISILSVESISQLLNYTDEDFILVAIVFCCAHVINSYFSLYSHLLLYIGKQKVEIYNNLIILCVAILLYNVLIPVYGVLGAAISTSIAIIIGNILEFIQYRYYIKKIDKGDL